MFVVIGGFVLRLKLMEFISAHNYTRRLSIEEIPPLYHSYILKHMVHIVGTLDLAIELSLKFALFI